MKVLLVTGPLGAGKTTAVNRLLRAEIAAGRRVAVLVNEFGAVSVDGALVDAERPELAGIANLVNGCACCSLRSEVVAVLADWCGRSEAERPERVVLETTGLADPTDLVDLESEPVLQGRLRLAGCLTVISALTPLDHLRARALLQHQAALASLAMVSKADLDPSLAVAWEGQLRESHPALPVVPGRLGELPAGAPDPWRGDLRRAPEGWESVGASFTEARALTVAFDHPVDPAALETVLLRDAESPGLLRAKGIVRFEGWPARHDGSDLWAFQLADGRLEVAPLPAAASEPPCAAVVIGTGLDAPRWRGLLRSLERPPAGARRKAVLSSWRPE